MKIIFMGTPDFGLIVLKRIFCDEKHKLIGVITQTDKPAGRGNKVKFSAVKNFALENNLDVMQPKKLNDLDLVSKLKNLKPDLFVVAAYGKIIPESILEIPKHCAINVHASLLPKYRGAAPIQHAIINGEMVTGVTIMKMDKGLDTGDIILQRKCDISPEDTYGSLYNKLASLGAESLIEVLDSSDFDNLDLKKQDDSLASYAPIIKKEICHIDWAKTSLEIFNLVRALKPKPGAYTLYENKIFKIWALSDYPVYGTEEPGRIIAVNDRGVAVKTFDGALLITELQEQNNKVMAASEYLKGHKIKTNVLLI